MADIFLDRCFGWNDGTDQDIYTLDELIEKFSLDRVQKSGARFDEQRLIWLNGQWIRRISLDDLYIRVNDGGFWPHSAHNADETYKHQVLVLAQDRLKTLTDLPQLTSYFFEEPKIDTTFISNNKQLKKLTDNERQQLLNQAYNDLSYITDWTSDNIQSTLNQLLAKTGQKPGILFSLIRIATTWAPFSPQLNDTLALIGKQKTLDRLKNAIDML